MACLRAVDIEAAVGAGTDAGIFLAAPVDQIVFALRARPGVVGNLVGRQALLRADVLRDVVERARHGFVRRLQFAGGVQAEERRALFDGELIERQMLGGFRDRQLQFIRPHLRGLVGTGVNQIERITVEGAARDCDRVERLARGMQPSQRFQRGIVERLHAERNPVDAGGAIAAKPRRLDAGRIGLQRNFGIGRDAPVFCQSHREWRRRFSAASATACRRRERSRRLRGPARARRWFRSRGQRPWQSVLRRSGRAGHGC